MIILIPLGGIGDRFKKAGYRKPKPLINVLGKPIIYWLLDNLNLSITKCVAIPYNPELSKYNFESMLTKRYPNVNFSFLKLDGNTRGATETIMCGLKAFDLPDSPILCLDGDNFYTEDIVSKWNGNNCINYFNSKNDSSAYSFLKIDSDNNITDIVEKSRISDNCCCGSYGFSSYVKLRDYCQQLISLNIKQKNEYYLSGVVKLMIDQNIQFKGNWLDESNYICLGTPLDVRLFCNNYPKVNAINNLNIIESRRYCFDLDNTLVTFPKKSDDYSTVEPIEKNIEFVRYLKKMGHTIIIYTARRMKTHHGNVGMLVKDIGKITFDTLDKFQIPYDEIYFGKPYADYYIDDLGVLPYDDLEKELGYYKTAIDTRSFNNITSGIIHTYQKSGPDLSGEIYWYNNIPNTIKDMFPLFLYSIDNYYLMERVNGIPFSRLMLSEDMTIEHLNHIMNSLDRIHHSEPSNSSDINIYANYCNKLQNRYKNYDYSVFDNSEQVYQMLHTKLSEYEKRDLGKEAVVHGDCVLTNILINQFGKIKLIDMRGKIGNTLSIYGDSFYDLAKLYQSLVGYDEILEQKPISKQYQNKLLEYFTNRFISVYGKEQFIYLKYITCSLLFTLLPLHDNAKCKQYYNLIFEVLPHLNS